MGTDGKERQVPFTKLSSQDIYRAVKNDLIESGQMKSKAKSSNPFGGSSSRKSSSKYVTDPAILTSLIDSVEMHIKAIKSDAEPMDVFSQIAHPDLLAKMLQRPDRMERLKKEFESETANELLNNMSSIDFKKARMANDVVYFDGTIVRLKKAGKVWKLIN